MRYGRRRKPPLRLIGILAGVGVLALAGAVFWFSGQADNYAPEQQEIRVEARNVGPQ
jgi:ABC-type transporter Mla subunit MlaD